MSAGSLLYTCYVQLQYCTINSLDLCTIRVQPTYTSVIKNRQHRSMLEVRTSANWCRQIADIDFVKSSKQRSTTLKSDPCQPPRTTTHAADSRDSRQCRWSSSGRRRGLQRTPRWPGVRRNRCDMELKLMLFPCDGQHGGTLSPTSHLFRVFQAANDCP